MRRKWPWIVGGIVVLGIFGNAVDSPTKGTACEEAFAEAAAVDEMQDSNEDLFPAVRACANVEEWTAASAQHPDALDGADPEFYLTNLCANYPEISSEPLCP